nr:uncharacterized protein LOC119167328 [Rhipicephalus microplus]
MITRDVLFVVLLSTSYNLQYSFSIFIKENELKEFLSTNDFIWTYNTSNKRDNHWCEVDVTERLQEKSIVYKHSYYRKFPLKEKFSVMMQGVFKYPNNMIASTKGSKVQFKHHLTYLDSDKVCAVIRVSPMFSTTTKPWYELRVQNWFLLKYRHPSITCEHYFNLHAKQGRLIYHPSCQKIIFKAHQTPQKTMPAQKPQLSFRNTSV